LGARVSLVDLEAGKIPAVYAVDQSSDQLIKSL